MAPSSAPSSEAAAAQLFLEGARLLSTQDAAGAEAAFRAALQAAPGLAEAHANLGLVLEQRGATGEAEACYHRSIEINPGLLETHLNLAGLLTLQRRFGEAEAACAHALALNRDDARVWSNLGVLYAAWKAEAEAEECLRRAIALDGAYDKPRFNLAYVLLRQGRFAEGWACLEARDWYAAQAGRLACPRWQGEPLAGQSILIGCEAGHGDMVQLCRYAAVLKDRGARRVTLLCQPALVRLFGGLPAVDEVLALGQPLPAGDWDFWTPPLSIPHHCATRLDSIPGPLPYLHVPPASQAAWAARLPGGCRVGLVWKGNPRFENDAERSLPHLELLAPLGSVPGIRFVSLQKGAGEDEARQPPAGLPLLDLGAQMEDFADTAAVVASLDLVISVDTAVAHLAGALGKPCWLLLPDHMTDWRWLADRSDSPWYPGVMRLFRQRASGHWPELIEEVRVALAAWRAAWPAQGALNPA